MKAYVITLAVGLLVGVLYGLLNVRSPAPPVIALIGLLGILIGEQIPPLAKRMLGGQAITVSAIREHCGEHVFGRLPTGRTCADNTEPSIAPSIAPKAKTAA
jgi:XapX domain-containing protein